MVTSVLEELVAGGDCTWGEITLRHEGEGILVLGPEAGPDSPEAPTEPERFRRWIGQTEDGRYRPLSGARSLRSNWVRRCAHVDEAARVVERVYPLGLRHLELHRQGRLRVATWDEVIARQRGLYAEAGRLSERGRAVACEVLCTRCVRNPVWNPTRPEDTSVAMPCPEPCGVLLALCRAAAAWEKERPPPAESDPRIRLAAFETPGNAVRETYLAQI